MNENVIWGIIYILTFVVVFACSVIFTLKFPAGLKNATKVKWSESVGLCYTDIPYGDGELNKFDLYVPADSSKESYGLVVYIHAGGFRGGDKKEDASMCHFFVSKGYVAAAVNYTLHMDEKPCSVYTMSREIEKSIPVIKEEAAKLGYNIDRMAMMGGSAGGCLALIYAYRDASGSPIPVKCAIEAVGPACFEPAAWFGESIDDDASAAFCKILTGEDITPEMIRNGEYKKILKQISPYALVTKNTIPTLFAHGTHDKLVPISTTKYLVRALEENNVPFDFIEFPHSGHGLHNDRKQFKLYSAKLEEYLEKYLASN
ncbi:MAG: alpha/beta hydrolase family protein [Eubacteriales bacterium]|jgi:acetyl esterase/lipase